MSIEHIAGAIRTLPPELRPGIAASLADLFRSDNTRFNTAAFLQSAGATQVLAARQASNPRDRAGDSWAEGRDKGWAEHGKDDLEDRDDDDERTAARRQANGQCEYCGAMGHDWTVHPEAHREVAQSQREMRSLEEPFGAHYPQASRRPFVVRSRLKGGGRTAGETWKSPGGGEAMDSFEFPGQSKKTEFSDNNELTDLPALGGKKTKAAGLAEDLSKWTTHKQQQGLPAEGDAGVHQFIESHPGKKVGPRGLDILHQTVGAEPEHKVANFFTPKVAGWDWDEHLNGYVTAKRQPFICTTAGCKEPIPTPSYGTCKCGKIWNTYAIGSDKHLASGDAEMFIAREIPVRAHIWTAIRTGCWPFQADSS